MGGEGPEFRRTCLAAGERMGPEKRSASENTAKEEARSCPMAAACSSVS